MPTIPFEVPGLKYTLPANADLSAAQYLGAVCNASGKAAVAGAGVAIVGVIQNKPAAADRATEIMGSGITKAVMGATVASGAKVMTNAAGKFITATATNVAVGICLVGADADEMGCVLLCGGVNQLN